MSSTWGTADEDHLDDLLEQVRQRGLEGTVRPVIAAKILGLSEKTVRAWASAGLLPARQKSPRLLLDVPSVHQVGHILRALRADGLDRDLLEHVWHRLEDQALLDRADLRESIGQLERGQFVALRPGSTADGK